MVRSAAVWVGMGSLALVMGCGESTQTYTSSFHAQSTAGQTDGSLGARGIGPIAKGGEVTVRGELNAEVIETALLRHQNQIAYCYSRALNADPTLAGEVVLTFTVEPDATLTDIEYSSTDMPDEGLRQCLFGRVRRLAFPADLVHAPVHITYPFTFSPG